MDKLNVEPTELEEIELRRAFVKLRDKAFEYLARREHSEHELLQKLQRFDSHDQSAELVKSLINSGALSDHRFTEQIARARFNVGKGPIFLATELAKHQIDPVIIEGVMSEYEDQWHESALRVLEKKFGSDGPADFKEWSKRSRFLQQRGFTAREIPGFTD